MCLLGFFMNKSVQVSMFLLLFTRSSPRLQPIDNKVEIQTFLRGKLTVVNFGVTI